MKSGLYSFSANVLHCSLEKLHNKQSFIFSAFIFAFNCCVLFCCSFLEHPLFIFFQMLIHSHLSLLFHLNFESNAFVIRTTIAPIFRLLFLGLFQLIGCTWCVLYNTRWLLLLDFIFLLFTASFGPSFVLVSLLLPPIQTQQALQHDRFSAFVRFLYVQFNSLLFHLRRDRFLFK